MGNNLRHFVASLYLVASNDAFSRYYGTPQKVLYLDWPAMSETEDSKTTIIAGLQESRDLPILIESFADASWIVLHMPREQNYENLPSNLDIKD